MVDRGKNLRPGKDDLFGGLRDTEMWSKSPPLPTIDELRARNEARDTLPSVRLKRFVSKAGSRLLEQAGVGHVECSEPKRTSSIGRVSCGQITGESYDLIDRFIGRSICSIEVAGLGFAACGIAQKLGII